MTERWRPYRDGEYEVSDMGVVRRVRTGHVPNPRPGKVGYPVVMIHPAKRLHYVHHMVAEAFLGPRPDGMQINHINGIKTDNRLCNLEYVTPSENMRHAYRIGLHRAHPSLGERHGCAKLTEGAVRDIRVSVNERGIRSHVLAAKYGVSRSMVSRIASGKAWRHVA